MISVAVVEDQAQYQRAIHAALEGSFCFEIVSQCQTGQEMLLWLRRNTVDILVVDLGLPDMSGVDVISFAQAQQAAKHIIVCSLFDDDAHLFDSIAAGATGYILKERLNSKLPDALRELYDGGSPMSPSIARRVLEAARSNPFLAIQNNAEDSTDNSRALTLKQAEILNLLARGFKYGEISDLTGITVNTVNTHIKSIYKKLQVNSRSEAIFEATHLKLIDMPSQG